MTLRVGVFSYPMLWQRRGGLQVQIEQTLRSLREIGVKIQMLNPATEKISDYDLLHVFSAAHGNHLAIESARAQRVPTVLTPLMQPEHELSLRLRLELASRLAWWVSNRQTRTTYANLRSAMDKADQTIALSDAEALASRNIYRVPDHRISTIGNGIDTENLARHSTLFPVSRGIQPGYLLVVGTIGIYKNQLNAVRAAMRTGRQLVLVGPVADQEYLSQCLSLGVDRVSYAGEFDHRDPMLASAYQNAGATILTSRGESFGLASAESLAAGVPTVITPQNGLGIARQPGLLAHAPWDDTDALCRALQELASPTDPAIRRRCQALVAHLSWTHVAQRILSVYEKTRST